MEWFSKFIKSNDFNPDIEFLKVAQALQDANMPIDDGKSKGVQSAIVPGRGKGEGSFFLTLYGNTFPIKDALKEMGFSFFKGTHSKNVKYIDDAMKQRLVGLGIDISALNNIEAIQNVAVSGEPKTQTEPEDKPESAIDKKLNEMKFGVELAMKQTGSERMKSLLGFVDRMIENVANLTDEASQSDFIKSFMAFASKFHRYSFANQILIWVQNNNASYVNGFRKWMEMGRQVVKWDKPIHIIAPSFKKVKEVDDAGNEVDRQLIRFMSTSVYDIADTEPIPSYEEQTGKKPFEPQKWRKDSNEEIEELTALVNAAKDWAKSAKIDISEAEMNEELGGFSKGGEIKINDKFKGINYFSTLIHEIAHEVLHWKTLEDKQKMLQGKPKLEDTSQNMEIDAETTAYIVLKHYGFETNDTPNYLALWKAKGADIKKRREHISKAVTTIIQEIDKQIGNIKIDDGDGIDEGIDPVSTPQVVTEETKKEPTIGGNNEKIVLSRTDWERIGKISGWL